MPLLYFFQINILLFLKLKVHKGIVVRHAQMKVLQLRYFYHQIVSGESEHMPSLLAAVQTENGSNYPSILRSFT